MASVPRTAREIDSLVTMLLAACDDAGMTDRVEKLLELPDSKRKELIQFLLHQFGMSGAPPSLSEAFSCLLDDDIAERAYEVIFKCKRQRA
jgi:hypothetical protein